MCQYLLRAKHPAERLLQRARGFSLAPKERHAVKRSGRTNTAPSTVAQSTGIAAIMTSACGFCLLGVNTCHRCIEYLVFGLFDGGVGEIDCSSRIVLG